MSRSLNFLGRQEVRAIRYWRFISLFLRIVWREWEDERLDVVTAWQVAKVVHLE